MFEDLFGVSKKTFLEKNVVRGSVNDKFYDNKCTFCWGPYDEHHSAVRVRPCNHVFGRDYLEQMVNAPNGDHCPICRSSWFRPSLGTCIERILLDGINYLILMLILAYFKLNAIWYRVPTWMTSLVRCWYWMYNTCYYIDLLLRRLTNVYARNPSLDMTRAMLSFQFIQSGFHSAKIWAIRHKAWVMQKTGLTPSGKLLRVGVVESVLMTLAVLFLTGIYWKLGGWRNRAIFALVTGLALGLRIWVDKISWWVLYEVVFSEVE